MNGQIDTVSVNERTDRHSRMNGQIDMVRGNRRADRHSQCE